MNRHRSNKTSFYSGIVLAAGLAAGLAGGMPAIAADIAATPQEHATTAVSDKEITAKVKQRLAATASLRNAAIGVTTVNGVVTLTGTVSDPHAKFAAAALTIQVEGVRVLEDELKTASGHNPGANAY